MCMQILTVQGGIPLHALGFCQSHEHVFIAGGYPAQVLAHQHINDEQLSCAELLCYRAAGGRALVDAQPGGCGRSALALRRLSQKSGVHIIASTGFHKMMFYPDDHWIYRWNTDQLARWMLDELQTGMYERCDTEEPSGQTDIRAGQVKAALDAGPLAAQYEKLFAAAAMAAKACGAALMVHIEKGSDPVALAARLEKYGMPPSKTIFCHMDRSVADIHIHKKLCAGGIYMEYDTIARPHYHSDAQETAIIRDMLEAGFGKQVLLSLDTTRTRLKSYGGCGAPGLAYILKEFIPAMAHAGITQGQMADMLVGNPARVFSY